MKTIQLILCILFTATCCFAQVSNINWHDKIESDGETVITISYDLEKLGDESFFTVSVKAKINGRTIDVRSVTGDIGEYTKRGNNKRIKWEIARDVDEIDGDLEIDVVAVPASSKIPDDMTGPEKTYGGGGGSSTPLLAGISSVAGIGGGLVIYGLTEESAASQDYDIYKLHTDPDAEIYSELGVTRSELYKQANKKHKGAQVLTYGGIGVIVVAGVIIVTRLIGNSKLKNSGISVQPRLDLNAQMLGAKPGPVYGVNLSYKF